MSPSTGAFIRKALTSTIFTLPVRPSLLRPAEIDDLARLGALFDGECHLKGATTVTDVGCSSGFVGKYRLHERVDDLEVAVSVEALVLELSDVGRVDTADRARRGYFADPLEHLDLLTGQGRLPPLPVTHVLYPHRVLIARHLDP